MIQSPPAFQFLYLWKRQTCYTLKVTRYYIVIRNSKNSFLQLYSGQWGQPNSLPWCYQWMFKILKHFSCTLRLLKHWHIGTTLKYSHFIHLQS
jgi:hypothetical protein